MATNTNKQLNKTSSGGRMSLENKLEKIYEPHLHGMAKSIKDFYNIFIEPYLPDVKQAILWHNILKRYVEESDAVLAFRAGNTKGQLRRGWETVITNDTYRIFYTDNFFAHYFFKLACDSDYETNEEVLYKDFCNLMKEKKFPVRFKFKMGEKECKGASFKVDGKNPEIGKYGYKLAHVIDAGKNYKVDNKIYNMSDILKEGYFPLGKDPDWNQYSVDGKHYRNLSIPEKNKKIAHELAKMSFLRMVHPMNYFLSPKAPYKGKVYNYYKFEDSNVYGYDIGEEEKLISYVRQKFHERYRDENGKDYFQEFLGLVGVKENINDSIDEDVDIVFSFSPLEAKMTDQQKNFYDFLKKKNTDNAKQLVVYWAKKIKNDTCIDIYGITNIQKAEEKKELAKFEKGCKKDGKKDGEFYEYSKNNNNYPRKVIEKYLEYLENLNKGNSSNK